MGSLGSHPEGDLHTAIINVYNTYKDLGDDYWFSIMVHMKRITVEFGKHVPGTILRQRYEIDPEHEAQMTYPNIGRALESVKVQFDDYCRRWEAGEVMQNV